MFVKLKPASITIFCPQIYLDSLLHKKIVVFVSPASLISTISPFKVMIFDTNSSTLFLSIGISKHLYEHRLSTQTKKYSWLKSHKPPFQCTISRSTQQRHIFFLTDNKCMFWWFINMRSIFLQTLQKQHSKWNFFHKNYNPSGVFGTNECSENVNIENSCKTSVHHS